ncbi:MAG: imidazoleglycerol-phosphate dehydratase HisB [Desulfofustis sp. PB-SRB1]|mgnify:CR=1 FL=1|jgi:imidazoleglycerol-phosphate dehydratase|nr:imidazoleglycerol-phosphate dehydratase HisB [Desulfofustis sp. PB-SRB1]MBM1001744.1 imidazoleglycerol-phosphate dehydratase HisB [Desulfofustis sp. PB-SRB1]
MTMENRCAAVSRTTAETDISVALDCDGAGIHEIASGVGFLDHMLTLLAVHGGFDITLTCKGDIGVDDHHSVEDIGICLGQAFGQALGDKGGIRRYGTSYIPMDETLARTVVDISNRPFLHFDVAIVEQKVGNFDTCLVKEFFRALVQHAGFTVHIDLLHGENGHHIIEAVFKSFAHALRQAIAPHAMQSGVLSSKGSL